MADLNEQLTSLLSDPDSINRIKEMAGKLLGGESTEKAETVSAANSEAGFDMKNFAGIAQMAQMLNRKQDDSRVRLLLALRPHLSEERQLRLDKAVKMLKLLDLAPLLSQVGLFEL